jgi:hypothetical protein
MGKHEQSIGATDEWYTPKYIFDALGCRFNLDVAYPEKDTFCYVPVTNVYIFNGLDRQWLGFVWMNPPFGRRNGIEPWLEKFVMHGNGIALTPDRTSAPWWQKYAKHMSLILFVSPKIKFIGADGKPGKSPAQGTSLMSIGTKGNAALRRAAHAGLGTLMIPA